MLGPYFKSCEGCDYGNKKMPFQSWNVVEFSSTFAARSDCLKKSFYSAYYIYVLLVRSNLAMMSVSCFRKKSFNVVSCFLKSLTLEQLSTKIEVRVVSVVKARWDRPAKEHAQDVLRGKESRRGTISPSL